MQISLEHTDSQQLSITQNTLYIGNGFIYDLLISKIQSASKFILICKF